MSVVRDVAWRVTDLRVDFEDGPIGKLSGLVEHWLPQRDDYVTRGLYPGGAPSFGVPVTNEAKARAQQAVAEYRDRLVALSERLHANPETAWQETQACRWVSETLGDASFAVTPSYLGLETAFHATFAPGARRIGLCAEYDALPGLGHACGHNLVAAMSVGAALALAPVAHDLGLTVEVFGTPAEEGGGGKIEMIERRHSRDSSWP